MYRAGGRGGLVQIVTYGPRYSRGARAAGGWPSGRQPAASPAEIRAWWEQRARLVKLARTGGPSAAARAAGLTTHAVVVLVRKWERWTAQWGERFWERIV